MIDAALLPGERPRERLPSRELAEQYLRLYEAGGDRRDLSRLIDADRSSLQLWLQLDAASTPRLQELRDRILRSAAAIPGAARVDVLGSAYLYSVESHAIAGGIARGLGWALLCIGFALALALRSPALAVLGLVATAIPIAVCAGALGWAGVPLPLGTSLAGCAALAAGVAQSAWALAQVDRRSGLRRAFARLPRPPLLAGLALCAGFGPLALAQLQTLAMLGVASVLALGAALACGLWLMPSLWVLAGVPLESDCGESAENLPR